MLKIARTFLRLVRLAFGVGSTIADAFASLLSSLGANLNCAVPLPRSFLPNSKMCMHCTFDEKKAASTKNNAIMLISRHFAVSIQVNCVLKKFVFCWSVAHEPRTQKAVVSIVDRGWLKLLSVRNFFFSFHFIGRRV